MNAQSIRIVRLVPTAPYANLTIEGQWSVTDDDNWAAACAEALAQVDAAVAAALAAQAPPPPARALVAADPGWQDEPAGPEPVHPAERATYAAAPDGTPVRILPGAAAAEAPGARGAAAATDKQLRYLYTLGRKRLGSEAALETWCAEAYGCVPGNLSRAEASAAIEHLSEETP